MTAQNTTRAHLRAAVLGLLAIAGLGVIWLAYFQGRSAERFTSASSASDEDRRTAEIDSLAREGRFLQAITLTERQLEFYRAQTGQSAALIECLERLGKLQFDQGAGPAANRNFREALLLRRRFEDTSTLGFAHCLSLLARTEKLQSLVDSSRTHFEQAIAITRAVGGPRHPQIAENLCGLAAMMRWDAAKRPRAAEMVREALALRRSALGLDHPDVADAETDLAIVLLQLGEVREARELLDHALPIRRREVGPDHPELGVTLSMCANANFRDGRLEEAERIYRECGQLYERARRNMTRGPNRIKFRPKVQEALATTLLEEGKTDEAWPALERGLATYMSEVLSVDGAGGPAFPLERVQRALSPHEAMIGWVMMTVVNERADDLWGFVIRDQGPVHWVRLEMLPSTTLKTAQSPRISELQKELESTSDWPSQVPTSERLKVLGQRVWEERITPLEPWLADVDRLVVTSSSSFISVPLEALVDDEGRALSERFAVAYSPSATTFALLREQSLAHPPIEKRHALVLADPPFTEAQMAEMERRPGNSPSESLLAAAPLPSDDLLAGALRGNHAALRLLPRLGWSRREAIEIASILPNSTVLLGPEASESKLRELAKGKGLRRYDTLHFASHALRDPRLPGVSALVVSQVDVERPDSAEQARGDEPYVLSDNDGLLLPEEFAQFPMDADLVVLSGCATFGYPEFGAVYGLGSGFLQAGARTLVVSLWRVEDRATSLLMTQFYRNLAAPMPKVEALRRAKLWLRDYVDADGSHPFAHPAYWSPFILIGDPGE